MCVCVRLGPFGPLFLGRTQKIRLHYIAVGTLTWENGVRSEVFYRVGYCLGPRWERLPLVYLASYGVNFWRKVAVFVALWSALKSFSLKNFFRHNSDFISFEPVDLPHVLHNLCDNVFNIINFFGSYGPAKKSTLWKTPRFRPKILSKRSEIHTQDLNMVEDDFKGQQ